ncbi:hypothetical protein AB833_10315 [Chromatiales bacterium (ex Bugula neritina AB1)]|nr:hypothetical protein AB833_10315 [Chromatiales bacterium (ex Bugula neritina AB1)]
MGSDWSKFGILIQCIIVNVLIKYHLRFFCKQKTDGNGLGMDCIGGPVTDIPYLGGAQRLTGLLMPISRAGIT